MNALDVIEQYRNRGMWLLPKKAAPAPSARVATALRVLVVLLAGLLLIGCGGAPFAAAKTCTVAGMEIHLESDMGSCAYYEALALSALDADALFLSPADTTGLVVWVHAETGSISCLGQTGNFWGCYYDGNIELNASGAGLAHELLHHRNELLGGSPSSHDEWKERGGDPSKTYTEAGESVRVGSWYDISERFKYVWATRNGGAL